MRLIEYQPSQFSVVLTFNFLDFQVGFVTFFLSSILDNLTSTIVMVSLLRKLVPASEYRKYVTTFLDYREVLISTSVACFLGFRCFVSFSWVFLRPNCVDRIFFHFEMSCH